jgi:UDP-N-acetylglucosamine 2-epimerase
MEPAGFLDVVALIQSAGVVPINAGAPQKETCGLGRPCLIGHEETELIETASAYDSRHDPWEHQNGIHRLQRTVPAL